MSTPTTSPELPWIIEQSPHLLRLTHDHRWLKIIGFPFALLGMAGAVAVWLIPGIPYQDAWPMLIVGSLIGCAFVAMGMHLSFNLLIFTADRQTGRLERREGFGPFIRIRTIPLSDITCVAFLRVPSGGSIPNYILELRTSKRHMRIVSIADKDLVEQEAVRWAKFLSVDLQDCTEMPMGQLAR